MEVMQTADKQFKIVTLIVPEGISAVTIQGYSLEFKPAPTLGKGVHQVEVPMNLVQELKSHGLMTKDDWKAKQADQDGDEGHPDLPSVRRRPQLRRPHKEAPA